MRQTEREIFEGKSECYEERKQRQAAQLLACPLNDPDDNRIMTSFITRSITRVEQTNRQTDRLRQTEKQRQREKQVSVL